MSNTGHFLQDTLKYLHVASEAKRSKEIERYTDCLLYTSDAADE